ncbi:MAG: hypothetical protein RQ833_07030 [Sphingomonadaceae bacterium]|nr:hypothetical protein [Sphingomonadaceae bacterium]
MPRGAIALAEARADGGPSQLIEPERWWRRADVLAWVEARAGEDVLIGFDMSFAAPFIDAGAYLPGGPVLRDPAELWAEVERCSAGDPDLGTHGFITAHARHFYFGAASGPKRNLQRWRVCEEGFNAAGGGKASSIFDCVGASQVGKGSFAGMRLLHRLRGQVAVWPFDPAPPRGAVLCEIYTRAFIRHAGLRGLKLRTPAALDEALAALSAPPARLGGTLTDHQTDVLLSAAGMRALAGEGRWWQPEGMTAEVARVEGWTFGVA